LVTHKLYGLEKVEEALYPMTSNSGDVIKVMVEV
jgi:hypothetical protein